MAEFKSTLLEPGSRANPKTIEPQEHRGRYRVAKGSFTGDAAQNDTVDLFTLPSHAKLSTVISHLRHTAMGTSVTLDIGVKADATIIQDSGSSYAGDVDCLADGLDVASAGTKTLFAAEAATDYNKRLWEIAGIDSDPKKDLTITATLLSANPDSGTLAFEQGWVTD
jgi:hypothetical protein